MLTKGIVPQKRKYTKSKTVMNSDIKRYIYVAVFLFLGVVAFLAEKDSTLWYYLSLGLFNLFWEYYRYIFSPALLLLSIFLIKDEDLEFDTTRWVWLFIYYISLTTLIGVFYVNYYAVFNFYPFLESILWSIATALAFFILFLTSLVILFKFSPVDFLRKLFNLPEKISEIKDTFIWNWFSNDSKSEKYKPKTTNRKEDRIDKKKEELEEMMEKLKQEKESLAKSKQPKQLNISQAPVQPKKIKVEEKKTWIIWGLLSKKE